MGLQLQISLLVLICLTSAVSAEIQKPQSLIVNGVETAPGRYPYYVSLRARNSTGGYTHNCGATLISDRLILTAAHCLINSLSDPNDTRSAFPDDFKQLGLNFSSLPNSYIAEDEQIHAFVSAQGLNATGIEPNFVEMWFLHPAWDTVTYYADIAIGLLQNPVTNVTPVKLFDSSTDIYQLLGDEESLHAIGLGNYVDSRYSELLQSTNLTFYDVNNDPGKVLEETDAGSLLPRDLCGQAYTTHTLTPAEDGSGNLKYQDGGFARIIPESQVCVAQFTDGETEQYINEVANALAEGVALQLLDEDDEDLEETLQFLKQRYTPAVAAYGSICAGDSGGPLILKGQDAASDIQIGATSFALGCGTQLGAVWSNVQSFMQPTEGFDSFLLDVLEKFPDQLAQVRRTSSLPPQYTAVAPTAQSPQGANTFASSRQTVAG